MATVQETETADGIWPYTFEFVPLGQMFVDESYQRPLSSFWKEIAGDFDPALVGTLFLSRRSEYSFALLDGQTRWTAMTKGGSITAAPSLIYTGLSRAQEARLFMLFQTERRAMRPYHRFRAAVVAGDDQANAIERIARNSGFELADKAGPDTISAVAALEAAYKKGPENLARTLSVVYGAWSRREHPPTGDVIRGLSRFYEIREMEVDDELLIRRLSIVEPMIVKQRAQALAAGRASGGKGAGYIAEVIDSVYTSRS